MALLLPAFPVAVALANLPFPDSGIAGVVVSVVLIFLSVQGVLRVVWNVLRVVLDLHHLLNLIPRLKKGILALAHELQDRPDLNPDAVGPIDVASVPTPTRSQPFVGHPYSYLTPFQEKAIAAPPSGSARAPIEAAEIRDDALQEAEVTKHDAPGLGPWHFSSPLANWAKVHLADSGRSVMIDNHGGSVPWGV